MSHRSDGLPPLVEESDTSDEEDASAEVEQVFAADSSVDSGLPSAAPVPQARRATQSVPAPRLNVPIVVGRGGHANEHALLEYEDQSNEQAALLFDRLTAGSGYSGAPLPRAPSAYALAPSVRPVFTGPVRRERPHPPGPADPVIAGGAQPRPRFPTSHLYESRQPSVLDSRLQHVLNATRASAIHRPLRAYDSSDEKAAPSGGASSNDEALATKPTTTGGNSASRNRVHTGPATPTSAIEAFKHRCLRRVKRLFAEYCNPMPTDELRLRGLGMRRLISQLSDVLRVSDRGDPVCPARVLFTVFVPRMMLEEDVFLQLFQDAYTADFKCYKNRSRRHNLPPDDPDPACMDFNRAKWQRISDRCPPIRGLHRSLPLQAISVMMNMTGGSDAHSDPRSLLFKFEWEETMYTPRVSLSFSLYNQIEDSWFVESNQRLQYLHPMLQLTAKWMRLPFLSDHHRVTALGEFLTRLSLLDTSWIQHVRVAARKGTDETIPLESRGISGTQVAFFYQNMPAAIQGDTETSLGHYAENYPLLLDFIARYIEQCFKNKEYTWLEIGITAPRLIAEREWEWQHAAGPQSIFIGSYSDVQNTVRVTCPQQPAWFAQPGTDHFVGDMDTVVIPSR